MRMVPNPLGQGTGLQPTLVAPDRTVLARAMRRTAGAGRPVGVYRPDQGFAVMTVPDRSPVLLGWYSGLEQEVFDGGGQPTTIVAPFARHSAWSVGVTGDERFVVADTDRYDIRIFDSQGVLRRIVRRSLDPIRVEDRWVEDWKDRQREADWVRGRLPELERGWARMTVNETLPALEWLTVDSEGCLWVLQPSVVQETEAVYDVFDNGGRLLGEVRAPLGMRPLPQPRIGKDYLMAVWADELGVESVRIYELQGRS